jgi:hypothetical protein
MKMYLFLTLIMACTGVHAERQIPTKQTNAFVTTGNVYAPGELLIKANSDFKLQQAKMRPVDAIAQDIVSFGAPGPFATEKLVDSAFADFQDGLEAGIPGDVLFVAKTLFFSSIRNECTVWRTQVGNMIVDAVRAGDLLTVQQMYSITVKKGSRIIYATANGSSGTYAFLCGTTNAQVPASSAFMLGFGNYLSLVSGTP